MNFHRGGSKLHYLMDCIINALMKDDVKSFKEEAPGGFYLLSPPSYMEEIFRNKPNLVAFASYYGAARCLAYLIENGSDLTNLDELGRDAIHFACANNKAAIVEKLCESYGQQYNQDNQLKTPLHYAVENNSIDAVNVLLSYHVNVNAQDVDGMAPLHYVTNEVIAQKLLDENANINKRANDGATPLCMAAKHGNSNIVKVLMSNGAKLRIKTRNGWTIFHFSALSCNVKTTRLIYKQYKDVYDIDYCGRSPLHYSAESGDVFTTLFFIKHGCDPNLPDKAGMTPLHFAASTGNLASARLIINQGGKVEMKDNVGRSCLHFAALSNDSETIKFFSNLLPSDDRTLHGANPLHIAAEGDCDKSVNMFSKENIDSDSFYGKTPLAVAAEHGSESAVKALLKLGASIATPDRSGFTPIDKAIIGSSERVVELLSDAGAVPSPMWSRSSSRSNSQVCSAISSPILRSRISPAILDLLSQ